MGKNNKIKHQKPFRYVEPNEHVSDTKKMEPVADTAKEFSRVTTVHGLYYLSSSSSWAKIFWIIAVAVAIIGTSIQVMSIWQLRYDSPVITQLETISLPIDKINFPAVTICPQGFISSVMDTKLFYQFEKWFLEKNEAEDSRAKRNTNEARKMINLTHDRLTEYLHEFLGDIYPGANDNPTKMVSLMTSDNPDRTMQNEAIFVPEKDFECNLKSNQMMIDHLNQKINHQCPFGFKNNVNGTCIIPGEVEMTYNEASTFCQTKNGANVLYLDTYEEIVALEELLLLGEKCKWTISLPETRIGGPWVNEGIPVPATIAFCLHNEDAWIVGLHDGNFLKMVKLRVTGANTFHWISSKSVSDGSYDESCLTSFSESCFDGDDIPEFKYKVQLVAKGSTPTTLTTAITDSTEPTPKTFVKAEKKTCHGNAYGNYDTLDEAKHNCSIDTECQGIYDMNCNGPDFKLCPIQKKIRNSSTGTSCVYVKEVPTPSKRYTVDCTKRNFQDSVNYCIDNGWKIASFQSDDDVNEVKDKVTCNAYIGATSDGNGNWKWIDDSPWWAYANNDALKGTAETKIVMRAADSKWNDWSVGDKLLGVICKDPGIRNTEATATTESAEFYFETEGSDTCSQGEAIMDIKTCREACKTLNVKESGIFGGNVCYKDIQGRCNQNGKNGPVASLICKRAASFTWNGPTTKVWTNTNESNEFILKLEFIHNQSLEKCKERCQDLNSESGCNVIKYDSFNDTCTLLAIPKAIPNPDKAFNGPHIEFKIQDSLVGYYMSIGDDIPLKVPEGCEILADPPNPGFEKGCRGAVTLSGFPSNSYCTNTGNSKDRFKWFKDCCKWEMNECIPKTLEEETLFLWLNSDKQNTKLLQKIGTIEDNGTLTIEKSLKTMLDTNNTCIGIIVDKKNEKAKLVSRSCDQKNRFLCSLNKFQFQPAVKLTKFPCVQPKASIKESNAVNEFRGKRGVREEKQDDINTAGNETGKPLNLQQLEKSLDPEKEEERRDQKVKSFNAYQERFGNLEYDKIYHTMFELLWYSQLPCYDVRGLTSDHKDELSFLKKCFWKEQPVSCAAIFQTRPSDKGMCCAFNMEKAESVLKESNYTKAISLRQSHDSKRGFDTNEKPNWFLENYEPIPKAGIKNGLTLLFDIHSNKLSKASVDDNFRGVSVLIDDKDKFPIMETSGTLARPGFDNRITVNAFDVLAKDEIKQYSQGKRKCHFPDEYKLDMHLKYSKPSCIFECELEFAAKCLSTCKGLNQTCDCLDENFINGLNLAKRDSCVPWYFPLKDGLVDEFCDPWNTEKFKNILKKKIPRNQCSHCLEDCTSTIYDASVSYSELQKCDSTTVGNFLCDLTNQQINPAPWVSDAINEFIHSNETVPWYLQTNSAHHLKEPRFSNIRSRLQEFDANKDEIFTSKLISNPTYDAFEKDIGMINVFFEKSHIARYVRANRMSTFDFVAQIGGSLGLFMGISLISIVEIIYWVFLRLFGKLL